MTQDEEIRRGMEAERLLNEPLLREAFSSIESGIVDAMRQAKLADRDTQHELVLMLQLLGRIESRIKQHVQTGKLARLQKETMTDKVKRTLRI